MHANSDIDTQLRRDYRSNLASFCRTYRALKTAGQLEERQKQWVDAAAEATDRLNLTPAQLRAVLRVPPQLAVNQPAVVAAQPHAPEVFYRMQMLANVANELTRIFQHSSVGADAAARRWLRIEHLDGPYKAQRPLNAVMTGATHELKRLDNYLRVN